MSFMELNGFAGFPAMGGLGRLPRMDDPCAKTGDGRATINTQQEEEVKGRLEVARTSVEQGLAEFDDLIARAQTVPSVESDILQREALSAASVLEQSLVQITNQEDNIKAMEANWLSAPQPWIGGPNRCFYAADLYKKVMPGVQAAEDMARTALRTANLRSLRQSIMNMIANSERAEAARQQQQIALEEQKRAEEMAAEERRRAEEARRDEEARIREEQEARRAAALESELEMQRIAADIERQRMEAEQKAAEEQREFERMQWEQAHAVSAAPVEPAVVETGPPAWLAELLAALAVKAGPSIVPMAEATPTAEVYAYDPFGRPVDQYGNLIQATAYAPAPAPMPQTQYVQPSYYESREPLAVTRQAQPMPQQIPGSPFQMVQFEPGNELFGLGASPEELAQQAASLELQANSVQGADPNYAAQLRTQAQALRATAAQLHEQRMSSGTAQQAADRAAASALPAGRQDEDEDSGGGGGGFFTFMNKLVDTAGRAALQVTGKSPAVAQQTKGTSPLVWILPVGAAGVGIYLLSRFLK